MPKIDPDKADVRKGAAYPPPFGEPCAARVRRPLGDVAGLTQFGVNQLTLPPGTWSSQRHHHSHEDEFVMVLAGEVVLVEDGGETVLRAGDCAGFPAGSGNGHHLINRSDAPATVLEAGSRRDDVDTTVYPDIDLVWRAGDTAYSHRDGTPYPPT